METRNTVNPAQNSLRSFSLLTGVAIAIICALVSLKNTNTPESSDSSAQVSMETPTFAKLRSINNAGMNSLMTVLLAVKR